MWKKTAPAACALVHVVGDLLRRAGQVRVALFGVDVAGQCAGQNQRTVFLGELRDDGWRHGTTGG